MTDNGLSQEEIDALMGGSSSINNYSDILTSEHIDALGEIGNISFGSSATALSELLRHKTEITTPAVSVITCEELAMEFTNPYVSVKVNYIEGIIGENVLIIDMKDAAIIANLMMGGDGLNVSADNIGEMELSAVQEAMNQMMGKSATSMSMIFNKRVDISPPETMLLDINNNQGTENLPGDEPLVKISFQLKIGDLIDSEVMMLLKADFAKELVDNLLNQSIPEPAQKPVPQQETKSVQPTHKPEVRQAGKTVVPSVQPAIFSDFPTGPISEGENSLDLLYDIPLQISVELGRTKRSVQEILELRNGSIIELDRLAGEHVDILVNDKLIAKGEVVVIEENFGVRVTDIISPKDRMKKIR